ncbi:MAG TPA: hypothetical protein DCM86_09100 [Verrucomicrobiales bacterium]|nr:hypothetical protein [Verrucomicrobiales bacterium]
MANLRQQAGLLVSRVRNAGSILWRLEARLRGIELGEGCVMAGRPILSVAPGSRFVLGEGVHLNSAPRTNPLGCFQPCVLRTLAPGAVLELGRGVGLSGTVLAAGLEIRVGEGTIFGSGAMVFDNDFHFQQGEWDWGYDSTRNARPVRIGRGCFIGARAILLKGVTLGDRAIVGAGAVVTRDVPAGHIAVGNPARILPPRA